jgi:hypothetical protein
LQFILQIQQDLTLPLVTSAPFSTWAFTVMRAAAARPPPVTFVATTLSPLQLSRIPHVYMTVYQCVVAAQQARL